MALLNYTTVDRIYDVVPLIGSLSSLTSSQIVTAFAQPAEAIINAMIVGQYVVPVPGTPPLLQAVADDISIYRILSRRIFTQERLKDSVWPDRFKEALGTLKKIQTGELKLVDDSGDLITTRSDVVDVFSTTQRYKPTFHDGDPLSTVVDPDKIDDLDDERNL